MTIEGSAYWNGKSERNIIPNGDAWRRSRAGNWTTLLPATMSKGDEQDGHAADASFLIWLNAHLTSCGAYIEMVDVGHKLDGKIGQSWHHGQA